jgi:hypothetical protein
MRRVLRKARAVAMAESVATSKAKRQGLVEPLQFTRSIAAGAGTSRDDTDNAVRAVTSLGDMQRVGLHSEPVSWRCGHGRPVSADGRRGDA